MDMLRTLKVGVITFVLLSSLIMTSQVFAIGSGGILVLVPHAQVWMEQNGTTQRMKDWLIYVGRVAEFT
jgi:hypothetical protein